VEVAHVHSLGRHQRLKLLEQLVAMSRAVAQHEQHGGLGETLEAGANTPASGAHTAAAARAAGELHPPFHVAVSDLQCKTQIAAGYQFEPRHRVGYSRPPCGTPAPSWHAAARS